MKPLDNESIIDQLQTLSDWSQDAAFIKRKLVFKDFEQAFEFMTQVAKFAEQANHHPNWSNVYNVVEIALSTHDANGLTQRDFDLARQIDALALSYDL